LQFKNIQNHKKNLQNIFLTQKQTFYLGYTRTKNPKGIGGSAARKGIAPLSAGHA
jgi:hypothetical protein